MNTDTQPEYSGAVWEHLSKANALLRVAADNEHFAALSDEVIKNYLWALEEHIQSAKDCYQKIFK
jgi:hypothetical protein